MLEEMIDTVHLLYGVLAICKPLLELYGVGCAVHLCVFCAVKGEYRTFDFRQLLAGIYGQEVAYVWIFGLLQCLCENRLQSFRYAVR